MTALRPWLLYAMTLLGSIAFFVLKLSSGMAVSQPSALAPYVSRNEESRLTFSRVESLTLSAAKETGVQRILSVLRRPDGKLIELEWESDLASTLRFVDELQRRGIVGACAQMRMSAPNQSSSLLRSQATFSLAGAASRTREPALKFAGGMDVFGRPKSALSSFVRVSRTLPKPDVNAAALAAERLRQEEADRLTDKRRELESQLKLTGIVNNGHEPLAFLSLEGQAVKNLIVRVGDMIQDARVVAIDEGKGELRLDYAGKMEVLVKLRPRQGS